MSKNEANIEKDSENVSQETFAKTFIKENKDMQFITKELKEIKEKLDSFELSEEEQEKIIKDEIKKDDDKEKKQGANGFFAISVVIALIIFFAWERISAKIKQRQATQTNNI
jgi:hypothetical protein